MKANAKNHSKKIEKKEPIKKTQRTLKLNESLSNQHETKIEKKNDLKILNDVMEKSEQRKCKTSKQSTSPNTSVSSKKKVDILKF